MKPTVLVLCVGFLCGSASLFAEDIVLSNGKVLHEAAFLVEENDRVKISHQGGVGWFGKAELPADFLKKNGLTAAAPVKAADPDMARIASFRDTFPTFRDLAGKVHDSSHLSAIEVGGIKLVKDGAVIRIPFEKLPQAVIAQLGLNPQEIETAAAERQKELAHAKEINNRRLTAQSILERQKHYVELRINQWDDGAIIGLAKIVKKIEKDIAVNPRVSQLTGDLRVDAQRVEYIEEDRDIGRLKVFGLPQSLIGQPLWRGELWIGGKRDVRTAQGNLVETRDAFTTLQGGIDYLAKNGLGDFTEDLADSQAVSKQATPPGMPPEDALRMNGAPMPGAFFPAGAQVGQPMLGQPQQNLPIERVPRVR